MKHQTLEEKINRDRVVAELNQLFPNEVRQYRIYYLMIDALKERQSELISYIREHYDAYKIEKG